MEFLNSIYPPLHERTPLPALYVPAAYALYALTPFLPGKTGRNFIIFPLLLSLALANPFYTLGDANGDYGTSIAPIGLCLMYFDFFVLCVHEDDQVRYSGARGPDAAKDAGTGEDDCKTLSEKIKWSLRLTTAIRGIGWNWQVKGVPPLRDAELTRRKFVMRQLARASLLWVCKMLSLYLLAFTGTAEKHTRSPLLRWAFYAAFGWCGAASGWNGLKVIYHVSAAINVGIGLCEQWEWPPLFGSLSEAWSVRQMWSGVWHQMLRRILQKPGVRLARSLGLREGTLGSRYVQLYLAFTISMLLHEWQIFNGVRRDCGEFRFFMVQPVVITFEDFIQWAWQHYGPAHEDGGWSRVATLVGYIWTFAWFSYTLPQFAQGLLGADIIAQDLGAPWTMELGRKHAIGLLR